MSASEQSSSIFAWPSGDPTIVPHSVYYDPALFQAEQNQIFKGKTWHYVGLEAEIPRPFDYTSSYIGLTPVVVNRDKDGNIHAFVNVCAHRGAAVVRDLRGNAKTHTCVYHQWAYNQRGDLIGLPFRRGIKGVGGFPADFALTEHGLQPVRTETINGLIFATLSDETPPLLEYLGPPIVDRIQRLFHSPLKVLSYQRQRVNANWKLMVENVKDSYHGPLLHAFNSKFGFFRSTQKGEITVAQDGMHAILSTFKTPNESVESGFSGISTYRPDLTLSDTTMLKQIAEFEDEVVTSIMSIFPAQLIFHGINVLAIRQVRPKEPGVFEMVWTFVGYESDDADMDDLRLRKLNLFGAGGYVSMEDAHALELIQSAIDRQQSEGHGVVALGGDGVESVPHLVTETAIRSFWHAYKNFMGLKPAQAA